LLSRRCVITSIVGRGNAPRYVGQTKAATTLCDADKLPRSDESNGGRTRDGLAECARKQRARVCTRGTKKKREAIVLERRGIALRGSTNVGTMALGRNYDYHNV